jgi:hypothetical protein
MAGGDLLLLSHGYLGAVARRRGSRGQQGQSLALAAPLVPSATGLAGGAQAFKNELTANTNASGLSIHGK